MNNINNRTSSSSKEEENNHNHDKTKKASTSSSLSSSSSSQWLRSKDPRIVRVSRAFGGKDRHSKVCTVKGLRDRRVRLSVSTAIQLYDLQDRLGFNQPSKVVDWLLEAAKHEIDELPPLQIPPGSFTNFYHHPVTTTSMNYQQNEGSNSMMLKSKAEMAIEEDDDDEEEEDRENVLTRNSHHPSFLGLLNTMPSLGYNVNNNVNQWEEANNSSSNLGFANQEADLSNVVPPFSSSGLLSSTLSLSTGGPYFASHHFGAVMDMEPSSSSRYMNHQYHHHQMLMNPTSQHQQPTKPFSFSMMMTPKLVRTTNSSETQCCNKDQVFPSK